MAKSAGVIDQPYPLPPAYTLVSVLSFIIERLFDFVSNDIRISRQMIKTPHLFLLAKKKKYRAPALQLYHDTNFISTSVTLTNDIAKLQRLQIDIFRNFHDKNNN